MSVVFARQSYEIACYASRHEPIPLGDDGEILWCYEKHIFGIKSGLVNTITGITLGMSYREILNNSYGTLCRLSLPRDIVSVISPEPISAGASVSVAASAIESEKLVVFSNIYSYRETLRLADTFEGFLNSLGSHTRRDIRALARKARRAGFHHEMIWGPAYGSSAEWESLYRKVDRRNAKRDRFGNMEKFLKNQSTQFYSVIRNSDGATICCCAGFIKDRSAIIFYQLIDPDYREYGLSLTNNGFLISALIDKSILEFILPVGGAGLLANFCEKTQYYEAIIVRRTLVAMTKFLAIVIFRPKSTLRRIAFDAVRAHSKSWTTSIGWGWLRKTT